MCWNANCDQFGCRCKPVSGGVSTFRIIPGSHLTMFYAKPIFVCIVSYGKRMSENWDSSKRHHVILKDTPLFKRVVNRRKIDYIWKEMCILLLKTLEYRNMTIKDHSYSNLHFTGLDLWFWDKSPPSLIFCSSNIHTYVRLSSMKIILQSRYIKPYELLEKMKNRNIISLPSLQLFKYETMSRISYLQLLWLR